MEHHQSQFQYEQQLQYQQEDAFRQQYYQQQFLQQQQQQQQQQQTQHQESPSPHRRGQSAGSDMPMSPNPPMTPSSISNSDGSPMTAVTSPLSSGRSSTGQHTQYQRQSTQAPSSPASHAHYRSKSYSSGPIPITLPMESSPRLPEQGSSGYETSSKHSSTHGSLTPSRKSLAGEAPVSPMHSRDNHRRSETYSALQPRSMHNSNSTSDLSSGSYPPPSIAAPQALPDSQLHGTSSDMSLGTEMALNKRDSWREQEQFLLQLQQRDHQTRAKHKRESFYAAFQNNSNSSGSNSNTSINHEDPKQLTKTQSRAASPHPPSGIPQLRTKSRSGVPSTPTAEYRNRPTPPPRSRSRTPAGSSGAGAQTAAPSAPQQPQVPQQYSGELQSILRKSAMLSDDIGTVAGVPNLRPEQQRSPISSTPSSKSGTPLPQTTDAIPVPVSKVTKHLSSLDLNSAAPKAMVALKDVAPKVALAPTDPPAPAITPRQSTSNTLGHSHRRSIVFDIQSGPIRIATTGNGHGNEGSTVKMKDVGVAISSNKERTSIFSSASSQASVTRKRGKADLNEVLNDCIGFMSCNIIDAIGDGPTQSETSPNNSSSNVHVDDVKNQ
ncbi:hypothetical protein EDD11_006028 [Mortierella claussenii]|nr:hypothetical protein EDD11_006028 [Mortierella claussenii]